MPPNMPPEGVGCKWTSWDVQKQKSPAVQGFQGVFGIFWDVLKPIFGGEGGIRTLGTVETVRRISNPACKGFVIVDRC